MPKIIKIIGPPGCLSASTVLNFNRGKRNAGREYTIEDAYYKFHSIYRPSTGTHQPRHGGRYWWNRKTPTRTLSMRDDGFIAYHEIEDIVYSGKKETFTVTTESGRSLRVTSEHPFKIPGDMKTFLPLSSLSAGDQFVMRDND
jgi:hypothetical protein